MDEGERPLGGGLETNSECQRCGHEDEMLLDGALCEDCHQTVFRAFGEATTEFALVRVGDSEDSGLLVAVGLASPKQAVCMWLNGTRSIAVYSDLEALERLHDSSDNLALVYA